jgi:hypothetical protein
MIATLTGHDPSTAKIQVNRISASYANAGRPRTPRRGTQKGAVSRSHWASRPDDQGKRGVDKIREHLPLNLVAGLTLLLSCVLLTAQS